MNNQKIHLSKIHFLFSLGHRCNSVNAMKENDIRMCSGPFDYMYIDLETCFQSIQDRFQTFLNQECMVIIHKHKKQVSYNKPVNPSIIECIKKDEPIQYMAHDYSNISILLNQSFIPQPNIHSNNIYDWDRVCIFHHHNVLDPTNHAKIKKRCCTFNQIYETFCKHVCLFHVSKIIESSIEEYKDSVLRLIHDYKIKCFVVVIVCTPLEFQELYDMKDRVLFIHKKVPSYEIQSSQVQYSDEQSKYDIGTDNNYTFNNEIQLLKKLLNVRLYPYDIIQSIFNES